MSNRFCIVGLPRCGSTYAVNIIKASYENLNKKVYDLKEPFSKNQNKFDLKKYLKNIINTEIVLIRLFLIDKTIEELNYIIEILKEEKFNFIILQRKNIVNQLISFALASKTNIWWEHKDSEKNNAKVIITKLTDIYWLYKHIYEFEHTCNKLKIYNNYKMYYETLLNDIKEYFKITLNLNIDLRKQSGANPYEKIINAEEVKKYINSLLISNPISN